MSSGTPQHPPFAPFCWCMKPKWALPLRSPACCSLIDQGKVTLQGTNKRIIHSNVPFWRGYVGFWVDLHLPTRWMKIFSTQNDHLNHHLAVDVFSSHRIQSLEFEGHIEWQELSCQNQRVNPEICFHTVGPWNWQFQPWNLLPHSWTLKLAVSSSGGSGHSLCKCRNRAMSWLELSLLESHSDSHV